MRRILVEALWLVGLVLVCGTLHGLTSLLDLRDALHAVLSW